MRFSFFGKASVAILLAALLTQGVYAAGKKADDKAGLVVFTFDVFGNNNPLAQAMPVLDSHNIPATVFLTTASVGQPGNPTWDDIKEWIDKGVEVDSRADSNKTLIAAGTTDDAVRLQIVASAAKLARYTGVYPVAFSPPYGKTTDHIIDLVRPFYRLNILTNDPSGDNPKIGFNDLNRLSAYRVSRLMVTRDTAVSEICDDIAWAAKDKRLLVLGFLEFADVPITTPDGWYQVSSDNFNQMLDCAASYAKQGTLKTVTLNDALSAATLAPSAPPKPETDATSVPIPAPRPTPKS